MFHSKFGAGYSWNFMGPTRTPTPTRTSSPTSARGSSPGCRRARRLPRSACHEPDTHDDPHRLVRHAARFSSREYSRGCPLGMRACRPTRVHVYWPLCSPRNHTHHTTLGLSAIIGNSLQKSTNFMIVISFSACCIKTCIDNFLYVCILCNGESCCFRIVVLYSS